MPEESKLTAVYVGERMVAELIKSRLVSEGVPAILQYESAGLVFGITVDGLGEARVMVPEHLAQAARDVIGMEGTDSFSLP
ncbi:MAG: hypothetical protein FJ012_01965 [Chloroflexi bacterium]|nr:hypothetical protein [Chloroflexota bacterium]